MTQPAAAPPAATTPAAAPAATAPAPAATETPVATPAPPGKPHAQKKLQAFVTQKTYGTKPAAKAPMPPTPAATAPAEGAPKAAAEPVTASSLPAESDSTAASGAPETAKAEPASDKPAEALSDAEFAKRMARLTRASEKIAQERQAFAQERENFKTIAQRQQIIEQAVHTARSNPLGLLSQLGVQPQAVLDAIIADGAKPEATKLEEARAREAEAFSKRVADLEKQVKDAHEAQAKQKWEADAADYQRNAVLPVLKDAAKYELTLRALGTPEAAAAEIFALQKKRYQVTLAEVREGKRDRPEVLSPEQAALRIENLLRSQLSKLSGTSAKPEEKPANATRPEPANDKTNGSPTHKTAAPPGRYSTPRKPYTTRGGGAA